MESLDVAGELDVDIDVETQQILLAASHHDLESLRTLLRTSSANVQDNDTGYTPLHAAIAACAPPQANLNGSSHSTEAETTPEQIAAEKTLKLLFQNGAIWNDLDANNETPGCLALRLGLTNLYEIVVDAGVRAELLLNRMDDYEPLADEEAYPDSDEEAPNDSANTVPVRIESGDPSDTNETFLRSALDIQDDKILDAESSGVMMAWERDIMQRTADLLLPGPGLSVLNIGHGMGIIDELFQSHAPSAHHIVEAHPAVMVKMREGGWMEKEGVTVHEGTWKTVLPWLVEQGVTFDAIFFDTFAEDYKAFRYFFSECVVGLLNTEGRFSFFHGLGADRQVCYDVYTKLVEIDLFEAGFDTEWHTMETSKDDEGQWEGVKRRYFNVQKYRLPVCVFVT